MTTVQDIVAAKGNEVWSLGPAHSVYQAIEMMALKGVGALTVLSDEGELIGIISERDYARKVILKGKSSKTTQVTEIMSRDVIFIEPDSKVDEAMALMTIKRVRHLPVLLNQQLVGLVSVGDLVKSKIDEQSVIINQLERYIRGETAGLAQ
ncbi:CBS domain-containing protein [Gammaproteobacteria bacterium]|nr:CBS domain-containing protein [Gammaproteobacteria bacterium]